MRNIVFVFVYEFLFKRVVGFVVHVLFLRKDVTLYVKLASTKQSMLV